jgi:hypothetical protein
MHRVCNGYIAYGGRRLWFWLSEANLGKSESSELLHVPHEVSLLVVTELRPAGVPGVGGRPASNANGFSRTAG